MYLIESNIPIPERPKLSGPGRTIVYPVDSMKVGDSFLVPDKTQKQIGGTIYGRAKKNGFKLAVRKVGTGTRVWRVA